MAIRIHSSTSLGIAADANNDTWITLEGRYVAAESDSVAFGAYGNCEYFLDGAVYAGDDGITAGDGAFSLDIAIGLGGSIMAGGDGIELLGDSVVDYSHRIVNDGSIVAQGGEGVDVRAYSSTLVNNGTISAQGYGVYFNGIYNRLTNNGNVTADLNGMAIQGGAGVIVNTGTVVAGGTAGLEVNGVFASITNTGVVSGSSNGIVMTSQGGTATNSGLIQAQIGVRVVAVTVEEVDTSTVLNSGEIVSEDYGIFFDTLEMSDLFFLRNSGAIRVGDGPAQLAVRGSIGVEEVHNTGVIAGDIDFQGGDDLYDGTLGVVSGDVIGGEGEDTLLGGAEAESLFGGDARDVIRGRGGDDYIDGGALGDTIAGGQGDDTILGGEGAGWDNVWAGDGQDDVALGEGNDVGWLGAGDDTLDAGQGNDLARGGRGDDVMRMGEGADTAWGGAGHDTILAGGGGADVLHGGDGNDSIDATGGFGWDDIRGGGGNDTMTGGDGRDAFVFARDAGHDVITDFANNTDWLDLSALGTNFAKLNSAGALLGDATTAVIDLTAIGAEGSITLEGFDVANLNAADFLF